MWLLMTLAAMSAFGPISMDLYLIGLPQLTESLATTAAVSQLTLSLCAAGLGLGQLIAGPLSDRCGRRTPVLIGIALFTVASVLCAVAPDITMLLIWRFIQGIGGAAGIVIARAVVRDLYVGAAAARVFSLLAVAFGIAPISAPILGAGLLTFTDWRGLFAALSVIGGLFLAMAFFFLPESLPLGNRHHGGLAQAMRQMGSVLSDGLFLSYATISAFATCAMFAYISMSSFVLQEQLGIAPQWYAGIFAANSLMFVAGAQLNATLLRRVSLRRLLMVSLLVLFVAAAGLTLVSGWLWSLPAFLGLLALMLFSQGMQMPNTQALALAPFPDRAGAASSVLGVFQLLLATFVPPVVSIVGVNAGIMSLAMLVAAVLALALLGVSSRLDARRQSLGTAIR